MIVCSHDMLAANNGRRHKVLDYIVYRLRFVHDFMDFFLIDATATHQLLYPTNKNKKILKN